MKKDVVHSQKVRVRQRASLLLQEVQCFFKIAFEKEVLLPSDPVRILQAFHIAQIARALEIMKWVENAPTHSCNWSTDAPLGVH
ncbi:hypothetical protein D3C72_1714570 [compost metagenome]